MHKALLLISFFAVLICHGQLQTTEKNGKYGLNEGATVVLKPKYDSIVIQDEQIITAFRKKRMFYFNLSGEKIFAGPTLNSAPFESGSGITAKRNGKFLIIDSEGEKVMPPTKCDTPPQRYGRYIHVIKNDEDYSKRPILRQTLYSDSGLVEVGFDTLYNWTDYLITGERKYYDKQDLTLYDIRTGDPIENEVRSISDTLGHLFLKRSDKTTTLYNKTDYATSRKHGEITFIDDIYFSSTLNDSGTLYKWKNHQIVIKTKCDSFAFYSETIYALGMPSKNESQSLEIYDYEGNAIKKGLKFVYELGDERWIFGKGDQEYIGTQNGDTLSGLFTQISPLVVNGYRIVFEEYRYSYINDNTYQQMPIDLPIIFREKRYSNSNAGGGLIQALVAIIMIPIAAVLAPFTRGKSFDMLRGFSPEVGSTYDIIYPSERQYFSEEMAVFCWYGMDNDSSMIVSNNNRELYYNYIDTAGIILNEKQYKDCLPFHGGKAWAKEEDKNYTLINKEGKQVGKRTFEFVDVDENGFHKCSDEFTSSFFIFSYDYRHYYLFNEKNELLHKGHFYSIYYEDGAYYGEKEEKTTLIYRHKEATKAD